MLQDSQTGVIFAAVIGGISIIVGHKYRHKLDRLPKPTTGIIDSPVPGQKIPNQPGSNDCRVTCRGKITNRRAEQYFWLAVLVLGYDNQPVVWPKENDLHFNEENWEADIYEGGPSKTFSVVLLLTDANIDSQIREWKDKMDNNAHTGRFRDLYGLELTPKIGRILARVDGLKRE